MTDNKAPRNKKLISSSVHKKPKVKKYKKRNNGVKLSPKLLKPNMKSMIDFSSPPSRRIESNLSQNLLNSCIYDKRITASPSFLSSKRTEAMTDSKRSYLRNFIVPSSYENSTKGESDFGKNEIYYAQSNKSKKKIYTNSVHKTQHNTPLNTRKSKMYENSKRDEMDKKQTMSIMPISSMKSACNTVAKTQRNSRYISVPRDHPDNDNCAYRVYESSNHRPKKPHQTPRTGPKIYTNLTLSGRNAYQEENRVSYSANTSAVTKDSPGQMTKETSFELLKAETVPISVVKKEDSKTFGYSIFSKISNWLNKELTPYPCK